MEQEQQSIVKQEYIDQEERDRLNPANVLLRVLFIHAFNNSFENSGNIDAMKLDRKLYSFFIKKNANLLDLKEKIRKEFGFDLDQQ